MTGESDVRIIALKCPNCGGALRVPEGADRALCEHCKSTVMVLDGRTTGRNAPGAAVGNVPVSEAAKKRVIKIALWGTAVSVALPILAVAIVFIILAVVFLVLGLVLAGSGG
jgi:hypothetical protein